MSLLRGCLRPRNHYDFVIYTRTLLGVFGDRKLIEALNTELRNEYQKKYEKDLALETIEKKIAHRHGRRRFEKLSEMRAQVGDGSPPLITATSFEDALSQYHKLVRYVEALWKEAARLFHRRNYSLSTFLSVAVIEETAKLSTAWFELLSYDAPSDASRAANGKGVKKHRGKHFIGLTAGALINHRLDRILGHERVSELLSDAESGRMEELRQKCLYFERSADGPIIPSAQITREIARDFTVLSGELMAEVLGNFPWEFDRLIALIAKYEIKIGYDAKLVLR